MTANTSCRSGGLYIHVPFCSKKCDYCAFFSAGARIADWPRYVDALVGESLSRKDELNFEVRTLYVGGGTPSLMPPDYFRQLIRRLSEALDFMPENLEEFTIEVNPDDVCPERVKAWKEAGVNRVSMGVQSFFADELLRLGRNHNPDQVIKAWEMLRTEFQNLSIDLIFGIPGQTPEKWEENIGLAAELHPEHLSVYALTYEERTALTLKRDGGNLAEISDEDMERMFLAADKILSEAGYHHYETSAYAQPGREAIHNSSYWHGLPYLGLGPSASSYDGERRRRVNGIRLGDWLNGKYDSEEETLSDSELREEYLMTRLRTANGINLRDFSERFGKEEARQLCRRASGYLDNGLMVSDKAPDGSLRMSIKGMFLLDMVLTDLF